MEEDPRPESIEVVEFLHPVLKVAIRSYCQSGRTNSYLEEAWEVRSVETELETDSRPGDSRPVGDWREREINDWADTNLGV